MVNTIENTQKSSETISLDEELLKVFTSMSDSLKVEVLHYAEYLLTKQSESNLESNSESPTQTVTPDAEVPQKKKRQAGTLKGKIWMSDDFDEPLEEMKEYM